ncbi:MAG: hypothetical protein KAJ62_12815 [Desulfobacteraceae bacterium]|nr:hypothetical protein [Desulfobacteraceae bacterium]
MLSILIENFDENFIVSNNKDNQMVDNCLKNELEKLSDIEHLETNVIGVPSLQWDYRVLDNGFLNLMKPYMQSESYMPHFFLQLFKDFGCSPDKYIKAFILLEYSYYSLGVVDSFNFHKEFTKTEEDLLKCAELTQVRYAGQYLANYPRYILINNVFKVDENTSVELHKLLANIQIATGMGRGVFLKWSNNYFDNLLIDNYLQNSINILNNYFLFPVLLSALLIGIPEEKILSLRHAFSALTLFSKLRLEKNICKTGVIPEVDQAYNDSLLLLTFPGVALINEKLKLKREQGQGRKFPWIPGMHEDILQMMTQKSLGDTIAEIEILENRYFDIFLTEINKTGLFATTIELLRQSYKR